MQQIIMHVTLLHGAFIANLNLNLSVDIEMMILKTGKIVLPGTCFIN